MTSHFTTQQRHYQHQQQPLPLTLFFTRPGSRPWNRDRVFRPSTATFRSTDTNDLQVVSVDLYVKNNSETNNTSPFYSNGTRNDCLILRRGESFQLGIILTRPLSQFDILNLIFSVAGKLKIIQDLSSIIAIIFYSLFRCPSSKILKQYRGHSTNQGTMAIIIIGRRGMERENNGE